MSANSQSATRAEIVGIIGPADDGVIMQLIATGATPAEVLEGFTWATADDQIGTETGHKPRGAAALVCDILAREEPEPDEAP